MTIFWFLVGIVVGNQLELAQLVIDEDCPTLQERIRPVYAQFEAAMLQATSVDVSDTKQALHVAIRALEEFLRSPEVDITPCPEKLVLHALKISQYALRIGDLTRARLAVHIANLFKLVGVRNWYKLIIHEADILGIPIAGRRAPHLGLYTEVSYRLNQLHAELAVPRRPISCSKSTRRIDVVSLCVYPPGSTITRFALSNHKQYTERHSYMYSVVTQVPPSFEYNPQFYKLRLLLDWLRSDSSAEWLMYVDCDAFFTNFEIRVEDIVNAYAEHESFFLVAEDNGGINTGVMLVKRGEAAEMFFTSASQHTHMHMTWDQSMLYWELVMRSGFFNNQTAVYPPDGVRLVHQGHLNAFHEGSARSWNTYAWTRGDFIKHFAGCPWEEPYCEQLMKQTVSKVSPQVALNIEL